MKDYLIFLAIPLVIIGGGNVVRSHLKRRKSHKHPEP
jgi:hypothetical protein